MWMVISGSQTSSTDPGAPSTTTGIVPTPKKRMSNLFSRDHSPEPLPTKPFLALYASPRPKDKKHPLLTLKEVSQAFAVYPERPELINRSTLMKLEGLIGDEEMAGTMKRREGWLLIMPELEAGNTQASEMLKWLVGE
jgi:CCR4-NOT transcriptional complex subunit CAF120